jgi:iron complex transport system ATP-binding protein
MKTLLHSTGLDVGYRRKPVLRDLSFSLGAGELVSLIGVNGSGKSTLLRTLAGLQPALAGSVVLDGRPLATLSPTQRARLVSVVLTGRPAVGLLDVHTLVSLGRQPWTDHLGRLKEDDLHKVEEALRMTGTAEFGARSILSLSDGELQKVLIARALAQDTPLMLLDEPTAFLDLVNRVKVMRLLQQIAKDAGRTVLLSTHDLQTAMALSDRLLVVFGEGVWSGTPQEAVRTGILGRAFAEYEAFPDPLGTPNG